MTRTTTLATALLLATGTSALAAEGAENPPDVSAVAPAAPAQTADAEPYTGWTRGKRAPIYLGLMMTTGAFVEDGDNRLTTRDSKTLAGVGTVFRMGAVLNDHHRLGGRLQTFFRSTKDVRLDPNSTAPAPENKGTIAAAFVGPEYLYNTDFGLYAGASVGFGAAVSYRDHHDEVDDIERGSAGVSGTASVGYEWRASKWFALNGELFGGVSQGLDDDESSMKGATFGAALGVGF